MNNRLYADVNYAQLYNGLKFICDNNITSIKEIISKVIKTNAISLNYGNITIFTDDGKTFNIVGDSSCMKNIFPNELLYTADTQFIDIKYFSDEIEKLRFIDSKSDWIDLRSAVDISLKTGEHKLIPLGIGMILPEGYEAHIVPRSSTFKNWGIIQTNHMGIIDESYCGDNDQWCLPVIALRTTKIHKNDRICQFRLIKKTEPIDFTRVKTLGNTDRGGFGSTGAN